MSSWDVVTRELGFRHILELPPDLASEQLLFEQEEVAASSEEEVEEEDDQPEANRALARRMVLGLRER